MASKAKKTFILYRSEKNRVIAGIAGGIAEALAVDPTLVRIIFLMVFLFGGSGFLIYILLWIFIPTESKLAMGNPEGHHFKDFKSEAESLIEDTLASDKRDRRFSFGLMIMIFGIIFLLNNFGLASFINFEKTWPVILIIIGFFLFSRRSS